VARRPITAVITIDIDPFIEIGPLALAWHGVMIAVGLAAGAWLAARRARQVGLGTDWVVTAALILAVAGIAGARAFWLAENGKLFDLGEWPGSRGYSIYGGMFAGVAAVGFHLFRQGRDLRHLDVLAAGFPLGMAVGRFGDVINGEHYGPPSDLPWAFRYVHPDAEVPNSAVAYHSGGFYEVVLALAILAIIWPARDRFKRPGSLFLTLIALYGAGRFVMFFWRSDSATLAAGLDTAQWTSLALVAASLGALIAGRFARPAARHPRSDT
jgi:phosphatidylglycerol:prolipoprotein diacylglycerol transferase